MNHKINTDKNFIISDLDDINSDDYNVEERVGYHLQL